MIQRGTISNRSAGASTNATALAANSDRRGFSIQNQGTAPLFVKFGAGCTTSDYDIVLAGGGSAANGTGAAIIEMGETVYMGIITVAASGTPSYSAYDL